MSVNLTRESEILLKLLANDLFGAGGQIKLDGISLKELFEEAKAQTVIGIAFNSLPSSAKEIDENTYLLWQQTAFAIMQKTLNNNLANVKLTELLLKNDIKHATIKGYASAHFYPKPSLRQMGDIDFLVNKGDVDRASKLLLENGFSYGHEANQIHIDFRKNKMSYEMHTSVTAVPAGKEFVLEAFDDLIDSANQVNSICGKIVIPSLYHHGVTMLTHMQRHMVNGSGIGLRHLCDWAVFVNSIDNDEWIGVFEERLKSIGLWRFAKAISKTASIYIKLPEKKWFEDVEDDLAKALIYDIFDGGNFGRKSDTRGMQQVFIDREHYDRNLIVRFFGGITKRVCKRFPFFGKYKFLLPVGYIMYAFVVLYRITFGKRHFNPIEVFKKGNEQFDTYTKLAFFQEEK